MSKQQYSPAPILSMITRRVLEEKDVPNEVLERVIEILESEDCVLLVTKLGMATSRIKVNYFMTV